MSATAPFPLHDPPVPISAVWIAVTRRCIVTFDLDIDDVPLNLSNWSLTWDGGTKSPSGATIAAPGNAITLQFDASPGVSQIAYDPPPFDVVAVLPNGLPAAAFAMPL